MCVLVLEYVLFPYFGNPSPRFRISFLYIQRDPSGQLIFYCIFAKKFKFQNYVAWLSIYHYQSTRQNLANDQMGQAEHSPGISPSVTLRTENEGVHANTISPES